MQKNQRSTEIKVGIIAIGAIVILIVGITLGKGINVAGDKKLIPIRFANAGGIELGAPVWINGVQRGSVMEVKPEGDSVLVRVTLDKASDLHADVGARVTILELTGGKKIEMLPGNSPTMWNGQEIKGQSVPDFGEMLALVGDLGGDAKVLVRRLDTITASLTTLLADGTFIKGLRQTANDAGATVAALRTLIENNKGNLQASIANMRSLSEDLRTMVKDNEPAVTALIHKLDAAATTAQKIITSADSTLTRVDKLVLNVDGIVQDVRRGEGSIGKLLYDKSLAVKLDSTMSNMQIFIDQVSKHGVNVNLRLGTRP